MPEDTGEYLPNTTPPSTSNPHHSPRSEAVGQSKSSGAATRTLKVNANGSFSGSDILGCG